MIRTRLGLKALGLSAMLLGLMAFSASGAQAAKWMVGANDVVAGLTPTVQVKEIEKLNDEKDPGKHLVLLTKVGGNSIKLLCTGASLTGVRLELAGALTNGGDATFTGCVTFLNGSATASAVCKPGPAKSGTLLSLPAKGQLGLFGGAKLTKIEPSTAGAFFADIEFADEECVLHETPLKIGGSLFLKDCVNIETSSLDHLVEVDPSSELWAITNTAEHKVTVHGSALIVLTTIDADAAWSGLAE
jgi:hypothetical protein